MDRRGAAFLAERSAECWMAMVTIGRLMTVQTYFLGVVLAHTRKLYGECPPLSRNGTKPETPGATGTWEFVRAVPPVVHGNDRR